jgi:hypothetical protein
MLERAAVQAVAYSDIFDYPLTAAEIHRYLIGSAAPRDAVERVLHDGRLVPRCLGHRDGYFTLPGREAIVATRWRREQEAARRWRRALRYGRAIASLPFVRMVAVTGELAMDNMEPHSDIDYFIVTEPDRLWLCRLLVVAVVRSAAPRGDVICPNYLVSERALALDDRNLYTAHEVAQMVPIAGFATYRRFRELNAWVGGFLPNAGGAPRSAAAAPRGWPVRVVAETILRTPAGARLEGWEMERKVRKLSGNGTSHPEVSFSTDWCKGHVDGHGERILTTFDERWRAVQELMP